jgi:peptidoglycan/LPS O-acetylase OafA/YrhL
MAAFAVVLTHIPRQHHGEFDWLFFAFLPLDFGALGVALFIVLSGFCIHLGVARGGHPEARFA